MSKGNIAIVLFFEYVFVLVASLVLGLFFGILLSKFAESILVRMAAGIVNYQRFLRFQLYYCLCFAF